MLDDLLENLDLLGGAIGNLAVTEADAKELLASLPADLSLSLIHILSESSQGSLQGIGEIRLIRLHQKVRRWPRELSESLGKWTQILPAQRRCV